MDKPNRNHGPVVLPPVGAVYMMPLADGRFGACRVIRHDKKMFGVPRALVVASRWIGTAAPVLEEPLLRVPLILNHHSWRDRVNAFCAFDNVPDTFQCLGAIAPTSEDMQLECSSSAVWALAPLQVLLQWRWDNDRDALLAEEEIKRQREKVAAMERQTKREDYLANVTLDTLASKRRFATWEGVVSEQLVAVCRQVFNETIDAIREREGKPRKAHVVSMVRDCVERLNQLHAEYNHFVETTEREDLCQEIDEIVCASGFPNDLGIADRWRDW